MLKQGQRWIWKNAQGEVLRRLLYLGKDSEGNLQFEEEPAKLNIHLLSPGEVRTIPASEILELFELEA
jgi:hypothetical protein